MPPCIVRIFTYIWAICWVNLGKYSNTLSIWDYLTMGKYSEFLHRKNQLSMLEFFSLRPRLCWFQLKAKSRSRIKLWRLKCWACVGSWCLCWKFECTENVWMNSFIPTFMATWENHETKSSKMDRYPELVIPKIFKSSEIRKKIIPWGSMDWIKGKFTGKPHRNNGKIDGFPVPIFPNKPIHWEDPWSHIEP